MTSQRDPDSVKKIQRAKYVSQKPFRANDICPDTQTDTQTGSVAPPGSLKRSVTT